MGAFENSDLHASAMQIVCINYFAAITALWKKAGFGQPECYLAPKPYFFVSISNIFGLASIFFERQLRDLFASPVARVAYDSVRGASIPQYQPRFQFGELRLVCLWHRLDADCLPVVLGHSYSGFLRGTSRQAPNF
jgi:hypothetical protein